MSERPDASRKESIQFWPLWVAAALPLLIIALNSTPLSPDIAFVLLGEPALVFLWACLGVWAAIRTVRWLRQRAWLQAAVGAVMPLAVLGVSLSFWPFLRFCSVGGDIVHFLVMRSSYLKVIQATPPNAEGRLLTFNRGGMIWASWGYVYDESDQIMRAPSLQTSAWRERSQESELGCGGNNARPFPGHVAFSQHWYLVSFPC